MNCKKLLTISIAVLTLNACNDTKQQLEKTANTEIQKEVIDPLASWNEGKTKTSILNFVKEITNKNSTKFVPIADRIAVFDNDGTLWTERPFPPQVYYVLEKAKKMGLEFDIKTLTIDGAVKLAVEVQAGIDEDTYRNSIIEWINKAKHPDKKLLFKDLKFHPMTELVKLLEDNDFTVFIVSGGGRDFMRAFVVEEYGIPEYRTIGTTFNITWNDSLNKIERNPKIELIDDKVGKPVGIYNYIGKKPIFIAGNSDGDYYMMKYASTGTYQYLNVLVTHTDAEREYEYNNKIGIDKETKALEKCQENTNWVEVNMKNDWNIIYAVEK